MKNLLIVVVAVLALCGCGGGGGGGGSLRLSLPQDPLEGLFYPADLPARLRTVATVTGETSASVIYVQVVDAGGVFATAADISALGGDDYEAYLQTKERLATGVHTGTLQVRICGDINCRSVLASARRPYRVTIRAPEVSGVPNPLIVGVLSESESLAFTLEVEGTKREEPIYMSASDSSGRFRSGVIRLTAAPFGRYLAELPWTPGLEMQGYSGTVTLNFCEDAGCARKFLSQQLPYRVQVFKRVEGVCCNAFSGLARDRDGNLYVSDSFDIRKVTPEGVVSTIFTWTAAGGHAIPQAVGVNSKGEIHFSHGSQGYIERMTAGGVFSRIEGVSASEIFFDGEDNLYAVSNFESGFSRVSASGEVLPSPEPFALQSPAGISVDSEGVVYVAEQRGVLTISPDGASGQYLMMFPPSTGGFAAAVSDPGNVLVGAGGLYRIAPGAAPEMIVPPLSVVAGDGHPFDFEATRIVRAPNGVAYIIGGTRVLYTMLP